MFEWKEGIFPVNKPPGKTSFSLISRLRKITNIQKIGHAGTLDPFAQGVMILLIGREYTRQSDTFLNLDKEYETIVHLGVETTTYDPEGEIVARNDTVPSEDEIKLAIEKFQGDILQVPPMYSAKKVQGKKLYELARKGIVVDRKPVPVHVQIQLLSYEYPDLHLHIKCSKGTYIRSLGNDIGKALGCGAYVKKLTRTRCGPYILENCLEGVTLFST